MNKVQPAMARSAAVQAKSPKPRTRLVVANDANIGPYVDESRIAFLRVKVVWFALLANTFIIPVMILIIAATYDVVAWKASIGAFIIAAGAISIGISFPFADRYRVTNNDMIKDYQRSRRCDPALSAKLMRLLLIGAVCAELPSVAGLIHFFATHEIIASLLLCAPAIALMLVAYHPVEPRLLPKAPQPEAKPEKSE